MHCPNCGIESDLEQKFCRKCGFNLAPVSKLIVSERDTNPTELTKLDRDKLIMQRMVRWMMWGLLALLIGIILSVAGKQFALTPLVNFIAVIFILGGVSVTTYGVLDALRGGAVTTAEAKRRAAANSEEPEKAPTTKQLEGRIPVPVPSVTERTTQLIHEEAPSPGAKVQS